jgi:hypothetical protein
MKFGLFAVKLATPIYNMDFAKKRFEKISQKQGKPYDPIAGLLNTYNNPYLSIGSFFSYLCFNWAFIPPSILLPLFYVKIFGLAHSPLLYILLILIWGAVIMFISDVFINQKIDRFIKYSKVYDRQPRKWKVKWAWISFVVLLMPLLITIAGIIAL